MEGVFGVCAINIAKDAGADVVFFAKITETGIFCANVERGIMHCNYDVSEACCNSQLQRSFEAQTFTLVDGFIFWGKVLTAGKIPTACAANSSFACSKKVVLQKK